MRGVFDQRTQCHLPEGSVQVATVEACISSYSQQFDVGAPIYPEHLEGHGQIAFTAVQAGGEGFLVDCLYGWLVVAENAAEASAAGYLHIGKVNGDFDRRPSGARTAGPLLERFGEEFGRGLEGGGDV
jgi:hypothetical protein